MVALSFFTVSLSATVQQSFIVIFPAMLKEFDWSRTVFSLAPALLQGKGLSGMGSALVAGDYGFSAFCGMIASGTLSDRIGREWSYTAAIVFCVVAVTVPMVCIWAAAPRHGREEGLV